MPNRYRFATIGAIGSDIAPRTIVQPSAGSRDLGVLSRRLVRLLRERGGRGPTRAKTYWAGDDTLIVLFGDCFTQAEKTLWAAGARDTADRYRHTVQDVLEADMREEVERAVGRPVIATMNCAHHDPDVMAEIFILAQGEPAPSIG